MQTINLQSKRLLVIFYAIALVFLLLLVKILYLVVVGYTNNTNINDHITGKNNLNIHRYDILDTNGNILALNIPSTSLYIRPYEIRSKNLAKVALMDVFSFSEQQIDKLLNSKRKFIWIKRDLTKEQETALRYYGIVGLHFQKEEKRFYPYGMLFSHIIGLTNIDEQGISGVERYFNHELTKHNVQLSLDLSLQNILHESLKKALINNKAKNAYGMIVNPNTGEILASASLPDYDPNNHHLIKQQNLFNYPMQGLFEPGSIAKVFTLAMALDTNKDLSTQYDVSKPIVKDSFVIVDFSYRNTSLNIPQVIMYSSNIGSAMMAREVGINQQIKYLNKFHLFSIPPVEIYEKEQPLTLKKWNELTSIVVSYGYSLSISQATYLNAFIPLINGGYSIPLTLNKINHPQDIRYKNRILQPKTSEYIKTILRLTVAKGTGKKANIDGYNVGGKTGSAEKQTNGKYSNNKVIASFVGFFPAQKPQYAILVSVDEPKRVKFNHYSITGGMLSAPVIAEIIQQIALTKGIKKQQDDAKTVDLNNQSSLIKYIKQQAQS